MRRVLSGPYFLWTSSIQVLLPVLPVPRPRKATAGGGVGGQKVSTPVAPIQLVVKSLRTNMYTPLSPNSKLTGMGGRPRARDKMWTLQLWVWGRGVRGKCIMQLSLLSCHIVLPPRVWTLFVRAPSGLHVFGGFSLLPCLHVCAHFSVCSCMRMLTARHTIR